MFVLLFRTLYNSTTKRLFVSLICSRDCKRSAPFTVTGLYCTFWGIGIWSSLRTHLHGSNANRMLNPIQLLLIKRVHFKAKWKPNRSAMGRSRHFLRLTLPGYRHCFKAKGEWYDLYQCGMFFQGAFINLIAPGIPFIPAWVQWDCKWPMGVSIRCLSIFQHAIFNVCQARSYKRAMFILRRGYTINNHGCPRKEYEFH